MKKFLLYCCTILVVLLVGLFLARNVIGKVAVSKGVETVTGFPLEMQSLKVEPFSSHVEVQGLKLLNPAEFEEPLFVSMSQFAVDYRLGSILRGAPHINDMLVSIDEIVVVKNKSGLTNVEKLKGAVASGSSADKSADSQSKDKSEKYRVDKLRIKVGTVKVKDFSGSQPKERSVSVDIDVTYENITDGTDINKLVLIAVLSKVKLPEIPIKLDDLKKGLTSITSAAGDVVKGAADTVGKTGKGLLNKVEDLIQQKKGD